MTAALDAVKKYEHRTVRGQITRPMRTPFCSILNEMLLMKIRQIPIYAIVTLTISAGSLFAQEAKAPAPPKNLKLIPANVDLRDVMLGFNEALGVQCTFCHVAGDFASDANPLKETARNMITLVRRAEPFFPSTAGPFPRGYHEVDCMTCHRGKTQPETKAAFYWIATREARNGPNTETTPGVNLKVLPPGTPVHGAHSLMEDWRDALNVDCAYCHGGTAGQADDSNPRKDITRKMIQLLRVINANFPGTGVYPAGKQEVTCYTCHRGDPHPESLSNHRYQGPIPARP